MKNQLKHYLIIITLFFGISLLLLNCEKENFIESTPHTEKESPYKVRIVKLSDIPNVKKYLIDKTNHNLFKSSEINGTLFDEDSVVEVIDTLNRSNYSFRFVYPDTPLGTFYNLIVGKTSNGEYVTPYVLKYVCDESHLEEFINNDLDFRFFKGTTAIHKYTDFFELGSIYKNDPPTNCPPEFDEFGDPISCEETDADGGGSSGGNDSSNDGSSGSDSNGDTDGSSSPDTSCSFSYQRVWYRCDTFYGDNYWCSTVVAVWTCPQKSLTIKNGEDCPDCPNPDGTVSVNTYVKVVQKLNYYLDNSLTDTQLNFLNTHQDIATDLKDFLLENNSRTEEAKGALLMTIETLRTYKLYGSYNSSYFNSINQYTEVDLTDPYLAAIWIQHFSAQCAILKLDNPSWSNRRIYWEASKEMIHIGLDIGGLVPVVGEVFDVVNGIIYTIEGDGVNATLSFAATIPIAGWFATGGKYAVKGIWKVVVKADGVIDFGVRNSKKFREALGLVTGDGKHAHHIIPWVRRTHDLVQQAAKDSRLFHPNEVLNGIPLPSSNHLTGHTIYTDRVTEVLEVLYTPGMTPTQAYDALTGFISHLDNLISSNPTLNLGQIADLISYP